MKIGNRRLASLKWRRGDGGAEVTTRELDRRGWAPDVHEGGKVFVCAAECIGNPASKSWVIKLTAAMAGGSFDDGGKMIALVAPHGADDGDIVDHTANVREPIGDGNAGLAIA